MKPMRPLVHASLALSLAAGLVGCNNKSYTDQATEDAIAGWNAVKSSIAMEMAESHFSAGQINLAEKTVEDAMQADPENPQLWLMAGRVALENSELEISYQRLAKSIEYGDAIEDYHNEQKAKPYYYQGIIDQRWQRYDSAKERYTKAYQLDADNVSYFLARVEMMVQLDDLTGATRELEEKTSYFDQNPTVRALLAHIHRRQGNHEKAALWFKQASMLAPEDMKLLEEVARSQARIGRHDEAARTLRQLTEGEYGERRTDLHRLLAQTYEAQEKLREARDCYGTLTKLDRTNIEDWSKLGELAYRVGDEAAALQAANRLINLSPDDHRGFLLAGMVWNKRERLDRALSMFDKAAELAPDNTTPLILRGIALQKSERPAAAADAYKQALAIDPEDTRAKRLLASVSEQLH